MSVPFESVLHERVRSLELDTQRNADRIASHEAICAVRYENLEKGLQQVRGESRNTNRYLLGIGISIMAALAKLVFFP